MKIPPKEVKKLKDLTTRLRWAADQTGRSSAVLYGILDDHKNLASAKITTGCDSDPELGIRMVVDLCLRQLAEYRVTYIKKVREEGMTDEEIVLNDREVLMHLIGRAFGNITIAIAEKDGVDIPEGLAQIEVK